MSYLIYIYLYIIINYINDYSKVIIVQVYLRFLENIKNNYYCYYLLLSMKLKYQEKIVVSAILINAIYRSLQLVLCKCIKCIIMCAQYIRYNVLYNIYTILYHYMPVCLRYYQVIYFFSVLLKHHYYYIPSRFTNLYNIGKHDYIPVVKIS